MKFRIFNSSLILLVVFFALGIHSIVAQDTTNSNKDRFSIHKGTILTGFSVNGIRASRDDYNHEFERAFSAFQFDLGGLYFLSDRIGIGPILGYGYQYRDLEDPTDFFEPRDQWQWSFLYGAKAGWYIPAAKFFKSDALGATYFFVNAGFSWRWSRHKTEGYGKLEPENRFGYQLDTGVLVPVGKKIALEWNLGWGARRENYRYNIADSNGQIIKRINETKWLKNLSLGIGLKVIF